MKILHTSDWHIGRTLYGRKRYEEYEAFLTWLAGTIQQNEIDVLLQAASELLSQAAGHAAEQVFKEQVEKVLPDLPGRLLEGIFRR